MTVSTEQNHVRHVAHTIVYFLDLHINDLMLMPIHFMLIHISQKPPSKSWSNHHAIAKDAGNVTWSTLIQALVSNVFLNFSGYFQYCVFEVSMANQLQMKIILTNIFFVSVNSMKLLF